MVFFFCYVLIIILFFQFKNSPNLLSNIVHTLVLAEAETDEEYIRIWVNQWTQRVMLLICVPQIDLVHMLPPGDCHISAVKHL